MAHLVDTNCAARRLFPSDPQYQCVRDAIDRLRMLGEVLYITPQVLVEFHALATRPITANGLGMSPSQASFEASRLELIFPIAEEIPTIYPLWRKLVDTYGVIGRQVYDARLVAIMQTYGITNILTLNPKDFSRFQGITVVEPKNVV